MSCSHQWVEIKSKTKTRLMRVRCHKCEATKKVTRATTQAKESKFPWGTFFANWATIIATTPQKDRWMSVLFGWYGALFAHSGKLNKKVEAKK